MTPPSLSTDSGKPRDEKCERCRCGADAWHRWTMRHAPTVEVVMAECASCRHVRAVEVRGVAA